jgi:hypothetical protein
LSSGNFLIEPSSAEHHLERKMHPSDMSPETREVMGGVQEILDSGVEPVVTALPARIQAFRLSAQAFQGEEGQKRAERIATEGEPQ